jgi:hypothetical protein
MTANANTQPSGKLVTHLQARLASGTGTLPSTTSAASLYLSNWKNIQAIWMAPALDREQKPTYGPRIAELHYSGKWSVNQINDYTGFFIDKTDSIKVRPGPGLHHERLPRPDRGAQRELRHLQRLIHPDRDEQGLRARP